MAPWDLQKPLKNTLVLEFFRISSRLEASCLGILFQDGQKSVPDRSKIASRSLQDGPRAPQDAPRPPTWGQLGAQEGAQEPSQGGQKEVKKGSYVEVALGPQLDPQMDHKWTPNDPKRNPNKPQNGIQTSFQMHPAWAVKIYGLSRFCHLVSVRSLILIQCCLSVCRY